MKRRELELVTIEDQESMLVIKWEWTDPTSDSEIFGYHEINRVPIVATERFDDPQLLFTFRSPDVDWDDDVCEYILIMDDMNNFFRHDVTRWKWETYEVYHGLREQGLPANEAVYIAEEFVEL
jgi:hypothetical protein